MFDPGDIVLNSAGEVSVLRVRTGRGPLGGWYGHDVRADELRMIYTPDLEEVVVLDADAYRILWETRHG